MEVAVIVTSDKVFYGLKPDNIKPYLEELEYEGRIKLLYYIIVPNDPDRIKDALLDALRKGKIIIITGGTGISPRDITVDILKSIAQKEVPGFGELYRMISMKEVGYKAILSRASAYIIQNRLVIASPGSPNAIKTILHILEEIHNHILEELEGKGHGKH